MNYKYKTSFSNEIIASKQDPESDGFISEASLEQLKSLVPENIDFENDLEQYWDYLR